MSERIVSRKLGLVLFGVLGFALSGFDDSSEYLVGANFYSPVSSTFGYYVGGQDGTTVSGAISIFF